MIVAGAQKRFNCMGYGVVASHRQNKVVCRQLTENVTQRSTRFFLNQRLCLKHFVEYR